MIILGWAVENSAVEQPLSRKFIINLNTLKNGCVFQKSSQKVALKGKHSVF